MQQLQTQFLEEGSTSVSITGYFVNYRELVLGLTFMVIPILLGFHTDEVFALGCSYAMLAGLGAHMFTTAFKTRYLSTFSSRFELRPCVVESTGVRFGCLPVFLSLITVLLYLLVYIS